MSEPTPERRTDDGRPGGTGRRARERAIRLHAGLRWARASWMACVDPRCQSCATTWSARVSGGLAGLLPREAQEHLLEGRLRDRVLRDADLCASLLELAEETPIFTRPSAVNDFAHKRGLSSALAEAALA